MQDDVDEQDGHEEVVFAIGEMDSSAPPVLAALQRASQDRSIPVRGAAREAIEKLEADDVDDDEAKQKEQ